MKQQNDTKLTQENALLKARQESLTRIHQKASGSYEGIKAIHKDTLKFTEALEAAMDQYNPTLFIFDFSDHKMDKIWNEKDVDAIISFDDLEAVNDQELFEVWLSEDVKCGLGMIPNGLNKNQLICYWEGKSKDATQWREMFESKLTY